jgi:NAD(P)-dependent dehydrogenase (short-subunit alcohol dehydrogenase family)
MIPELAPRQTLTNRIAVITGAARGIGEAIAQHLARLGAAVVLADRDGELAELVAGRMREQGLDATAFTVDVADPISIKALVAQIESCGNRLDILVNNAAILDATPLSMLTPERFQQVAEINQNAALWLSVAFLPLLKHSRHARVVNIASILGIRGAVDSVAYATAKGGLVNMTRALAVDLASSGILVNCICPGFVDTRMAIMPDGSGHEHETDWFKDIYIKHGRIPLRKAAQPADIAAATSFFCGDDCRYVTGQILMVDGGLSATF